MGRGKLRLALLYPELCRGKGGALGASDWASGDGAAHRHGGRAVPTTFVNHGSQGTGLVSLGKSRIDHSRCEGGCWEEGGRHEAGGGDEEGEEGAVDGIFVGAWLGKERQLPYSLSCLEYCSVTRLMT